MKITSIVLALSGFGILFYARDADAQTTLTYPIVDTGQVAFYGNSSEIAAPANPAAAFYGQDAQFARAQPSYSLSGDGLTVHDDVTGLTWVRKPDLNGDGTIDVDDKRSWADAMAYPAILNAANFGGYNDWRLPTIKELYSLMDFRGLDPSGYSGTDTSGLKPFIDTAHFDFAYGDASAGERIIDSQWATTTNYVSTTMNGDETMFGVNFADGRIKGYPIADPRTGSDKLFYVRCVRGNSDYGINHFVDNGDGTITDTATGLIWSQDDSGIGMNWQDALAWVQTKNAAHYLGHDDWRMPNVKELQSLLDYTRSPATSGSAAIDPLFYCSPIIDEGGGTNYPFYWSGTSHVNLVSGDHAAYVCFGEALGWMEMPPYSGNYFLLDVHGAGAQRSDPKTGNPADYPYGHGPQGDVVRIYNFVRLVRDAPTTPVTTPTACGWATY